MDRRTRVSFPRTHIGREGKDYMAKKYGTPEEVEAVNVKLRLARQHELDLGISIHNYLEAHRSSLPYGFFFANKNPFMLCKKNAHGVLAFADREEWDNSKLLTPIFLVKDSAFWNGCSYITQTDVMRSMHPECECVDDMNKVLPLIKPSNMLRVYAELIERKVKKK